MRSNETILSIKIFYCVVMTHGVFFCINTLRLLFIVKYKLDQIFVTFYQGKNNRTKMCHIEIVFIKNLELNVDQKSISPLFPIDQFITELLHLHRLMFANFDYQLSFPFLIQTPSSPVTDVTPQRAGPLTEDSDECFDSSPSSVGTPSRQRAMATLPSASHNKTQKVKSVRRLNLSPADKQQKSASQKSPSSMRKRQSTTMKP